MRFPVTPPDQSTVPPAVDAPPDRPDHEQNAPATLQDLGSTSLAPVLVRLLAAVLAGGFALAVVVLAGCAVSGPTKDPDALCFQVGRRLEERWESAISLLVGLLAGAAINGER